MSINFSALSQALPHYSTQIKESLLNEPVQPILQNTFKISELKTTQNTKQNNQVHCAKQATGSISTYYQAGLFADTLNSLHNSKSNTEKVPDHLSQYQISQQKYKQFKKNQMLNQYISLPPSTYSVNSEIINSLLDEK